MNGYSTITLHMVRHFNMGPAHVFQAWLTPEMMRKWLFTLEHTNKVTTNTPQVGGGWEIVDHREGTDYRAIGKYLEITPSTKLVFTFKMPQFSDTEDTITVEFKEVPQGCEMSFSQCMIVPHEQSWTEADIEKASTEYHDGSEYGWNLMFIHLKELVETGKVSYRS